MTEGINLEKAMRVSNGEPWTIGTEYGNGWLYYFDGKELHDGSHNIPLKELLDRECIDIYNRDERKYWSEESRKYCHFMELESGLAFIVKGRDNGSI